MNMTEKSKAWVKGWIIWGILMAVFFTITGGKDPIIGPFTLIFCMLPVVGGIVFIKKKMEKSAMQREFNARLVELKGNYNYMYSPYLALDSHAQTIFINAGSMPRLYFSDEIKGLSMNSDNHSTYSVIGTKFEKHKYCKLTIKTRSLDEPLLVIPFKTKAELELWYERLGNVFEMSSV
jgi:hypothetical protein